MSPPDQIASAFLRHDKIALQFSGGRDSTAALYLLRDHWPKIMVYHLDGGDQFPETRRVVNQVELEFGRPFVRLHGDVQRVWREFGLPSDLVPTDTTPIGRMLSGSQVKIIDRYECCFRTVMEPVHRRMMADGATLIIRGQRDSDFAEPPMRSGDTDGQIEFLYPLQAWSDEQVSAYLQENNHPVAPFYAEGLKTSPECMTCTAWWNEGRVKYLKEHYPTQHADHQAKMQVVRAEIFQQLAGIND